MKIFNHSKEFLDSLLLNSEWLLKRYRDAKYDDARPMGETEQGKLVAAISGYLYVLNYMGMIEFKEEKLKDKLTPVRIKIEYKQHPHFQDDENARACAAYITRYLNQQSSPNIYGGIVSGLSALVETPSQHPIEREIAGQLGVVAFGIGTTGNHYPAIIDDAIMGVGCVANKITTKKLHDEIDLLGEGKLDLFKAKELELGKKRKSLLQ